MQMGHSMTKDAEQPHANPDSCRPEAHVAERLEKSNLRAACGGGFFDRMAQHGCGSFDLDSIACLRSCCPGRRGQSEGLHHKHRIPVGLVESPFGPADGRQYDGRTARSHLSQCVKTGEALSIRPELSSTLIASGGSLPSAVLTSALHCHQTVALPALAVEPGRPTCRRERSSGSQTDPRPFCAAVVG